MKLNFRNTAKQVSERLFSFNEFIIYKALYLSAVTSGFFFLYTYNIRLVIFFKWLYSCYTSEYC